MGKTGHGVLLILLLLKRDEASLQQERIRGPESFRLCEKK
jgi:hypothetical protein